MSNQRTRFQVPLRPGSRGADVAQAQTILVELGYVVASIELREQRFGLSTSQAVSRWKGSHGLPTDSNLELEVLEQLWSDGRKLPRTVQGKVTLADDTPVPNLRVLVIDRDFRAEQTLGEARTDDQGRYHIAYCAADALRAEKGSADVGVRVFATDGKTLLWKPTSGDLVMNAPVEAHIDVTVNLPEGAVPSEFARIAAAIQPLIEKVPVADVGHDPSSDEGDFLARESGIDFDRLAHFVVAHRVEAETKLPAEYFYALLREDGLFGVGQDRPRAVLTPVELGTDTRAVLYEAVLLQADAAKAAVERAVRRHLVDPGLRKHANEIHERLQRWYKDALAYVQQALPRRILDVVDDLLADGKAQDLLSVLGPHDIGELPKLFERLDAQGVFAAAAKPAAAARLQLADLLGFNVGLVEEVTQGLGADAPEKVRKLAQLERKDWSELIERGNVRMGGKAVDAKHARRQASVIVRRFEKRFPTAAFSAQLSRRKPKAVANHEKVVAFLDAHPDFELGQHKLQPFLKAAGVDLKTVAPEVVADIEKVQRMFRLTGDYRKTEGLIAAGYRASADIVAAGTRAFLSSAGVERADLMRALAVGGVPSVDVIAGEALGISASERSLIFSASVADQPAIWGVAGPVAANAMRMLDVFTSRTGFVYTEVEALLKGAWVRSGVDLYIRHLDNTCNLSAKEIVNLDGTVLDRMHRELRLARRSDPVRLLVGRSREGESLRSRPAGGRGSSWPHSRVSCTNR